MILLQIKNKLYIFQNNLQLKKQLQKQLEQAFEMIPILKILKY